MTTGLAVLAIFAAAVLVLALSLLVERIRPARQDQHRGGSGDAGYSGDGGGSDGGGGAGADGGGAGC